MPAGLQLFDSSGALLADHTVNYGRYTGMVWTGNYPGNSYYDASLLTGRPWYIKINHPDDVSNGPLYSAVQILISGGTISWLFQLTRKDCWILYGVY